MELKFIPDDPNKQEEEDQQSSLRFVPDETPLTFIPDTQETTVQTPSDLPEDLNPEVRRGVVTANAMKQMDDIVSSYGRPLSQEDFIQDERLMDLVRMNMEARFRSGEDYGITGTAYSYGTTAAGGATARGWQSMDDKELFETWQNYHRSFAVGQSVTTVNELGYLTQADLETKAAMGMGYKLFDSMGNIFGSETSWGDMFDGVGDYIKGAVWDPVTILSLGAGKALSSGSTKVAAEGFRQVAIRAAEQTLLNGGTAQAATQAGQVAVQQALKQSARFTAGEAATAVARNSVVDVAANIGADIAYQNVLIETGAQEEYSALQTGISALGAVAIPGIMAARSIGRTGLEAAGVRGFRDVSYKFSVMNDEAVDAALRTTIQSNEVIGPLRTAFRQFAKDAPETSAWREAADAAKAATGEVNLSDMNQKFWQTFLFGDDTNGFTGLAHTLQNAGVEWVPRDKSDTVTRFLGDTIEWLGDDVVNDVVTNYEKVIGRELDLAAAGADRYTAKGLADIFRARQSWAGAALQQSSIAKRYLGFRKADETTSMFGTFQAQTGDTIVRDILDGLVKDIKKPEKVEADPQALRYVQSVWKRLLTAHPATTGLNLKGWFVSHNLNIVSDMVQGTMQIALSPIPYVRGVQRTIDGRTISLSASEAMQRGKGSILGALRRGAGLLDPMDTAEGAANYLAMKPDLAERVFTVITGDSGFEDAAKTFNMNPDSTILKATENTTRFVQNVMGVRLQDELTKHISFMGNLDTAVRREYGMSFNDFISNRTTEDAYLEMFSARWRENVDAWALDRTLRETASKGWTVNNPGGNIMREMAGVIEWMSSNSVVGYAVPFGRFFNTATAAVGDYTGVNFIRHLGKRAFGRDINFAEEEGLALLSRAAVGWTGFYFASEQAMDKIDDGLFWNQDRRDDGSIQDSTYDWPESIFRIMGQVLAHKRRDGEIPDALAKEGLAVLGAQTFRSMDTASKDIYQLADAILSLDAQEAGSLLMEQTMGLMSQIVSGATRPLDPVNQAAMLMRGDTTTPDRRQGYKFINEATRYIDHIFGNITGDLPRRSYPTRDEPVNVDLGRTFGGTRSTPENLPIERMMAAVGRPSWTAVRWEGPAEVKNRMDELVGPILNSVAGNYLRNNPDFGDMSLNAREAALEQVLTTAKELATQTFETSTRSDDQNLEVVRDLAKVDRRDLARAQKFLGMEGDPVDILGEPNGPEQLKLLLFMAKNWDDAEYRFWEQTSK